MDKYEKLILEIIELQTEDIVTTSNPDVWTDEDE